MEPSKGSNLDSCESGEKSGNDANNGDRAGSASSKPKMKSDDPEETFGYDFFPERDQQSSR